jgi:hypothetical protein
MTDDTKDTEKTVENQHYIDHVEFTQEMTIYRQECQDAQEAEEPKPPISEAVGLKFLLLAENLSNWHKFRGYTFRDELVGDAIENMIRYAHNFDPAKVGKTGAFSYFTQISYYAFLRRIEKEEKQYRTKVKWVQSFAVLDMLPDGRQDHDHGAAFQNKFVEYLFEYYDGEHMKAEKKKKKPVEKPVKKTPVESAIDKQQESSV